MVDGIPSSRDYNALAILSAWVHHRVWDYNISWRIHILRHEYFNNVFVILFVQNHILNQILKGNVTRGDFKVKIHPYLLVSRHLNWLQFVLWIRTKPDVVGNTKSTRLHYCVDTVEAGHARSGGNDFSGCRNESLVVYQLLHVLGKVKI